MFPNPIAEDVMGTIGTLLWTVHLIPQIWKSWREKTTAGLSPWLLLMWGASCIPLGPYTLLQELSIPLIVQPQAFALLLLIAWGQCMYYDRGLSALYATLLAATILATFGGLQLALYFAIHPSMNEKATESLGILASAVIGCGLLPQYWEIYKRKEVVGISLPFIAADILGGVFLLLSLIFRSEFDGPAAADYGVAIVMDAVIPIAAAILNPLARRRREREAERARGCLTVPLPQTRTMTMTSTISSVMTVSPIEKPAGEDLEKGLQWTNSLSYADQK